MPERREPSFRGRPLGMAPSCDKIAPLVNRLLVSTAQESDTVDARYAEGKVYSHVWPQSPSISAVMSEMKALPVVASCSHRVRFGLPNPALSTKDNTYISWSNL